MMLLLVVGCQKMYKYSEKNQCINMNSKDLRNIASVYEAVYGGGKKKEEKKDTRMVLTHADQKANTPAWQNRNKTGKDGKPLYKKADHLGEGKAESPEAEEEKDKKDDDLAGAPNKKGKKKAKRWWDDDGDGIGYEKGEVKEGVASKKKPSVHDDYYDPMEDPEFDPHEAEATRGQSGRGTSGKMNVRKKYPVKEGYAKPNTTVPRGSKVGPKKVAAPKGSKIHVATKEIEDLRKAAETGKGKQVATADKLEEKKKDTPDQVAAVIDMYRSKKGTGEAVKDTEEGKTEAAKKERDYAAWERSKMRRDDPDWKHKKGSTTESVDVDYIEIVREIKSAETQADIKRWGALEESGNFSDQELAIIIEADIADILARLEKKRISKGGDPEESPLPAMRKYHADKKKKKEKEEVEIDEGIVRAIKKAKRIGKRILDAHDSDPGRAHTIGTLGNPSVKNDDKGAAERKAGKKKVKEEFELDEAERSLLDKIMEADSLAGQVARWDAARQKRMKQRQSYERPHWIPKDQDHEDRYGSSKGKKDL